MDDFLKTQDWLNLAPMLIFKGILMVFLLGYFIFALVIVRQVQLMTSVLETKLSPLIKVLARAHLVFVIGVFVWVLILL